MGILNSGMIKYGYRIIGRKVWVANADAAAVAIVFACTRPGLRGQGVTAFLVPMDTPGITRTARADSLGVRGLGCMDLDFDIEVTDEQVLGSVDQGFRLAMWALHERPSRWIWAALAMGALGVCVALWPELSSTHLPGSDARLWGMAAASLSAVTYAGVVVVARHQAQHDALWTILLVQNLLPLLVLAVPMAWLWQPMPATDIPILLLMGALATGGMLCITWAFSHIEASRAAPIEYTGLVWAALLGFLVFGEVPTVWSLSSAALIMVGCLLLVRR